MGLRLIKGELKMTNEEIQTKAENIALANFLSNSPDSMSYDEVIEALLNDSDNALIDKDIYIWSPFEHFPASDVARYIEDLKDSVMWNFKMESKQ
jgi:hypothetical protein